MSNERTKLYQRVAAQIEDAIRSGQYAAGDRLPPERELAEMLKVSRPTVREAVIALEIRGLVEVRQGSGVYLCANPVPATAEPDLDVGAFELIEARLIVEGEAAALAAKVMSEDELQALDAIVARMEGAQAASGEELDFDRQFHQLIAEATRNTLVSQMVENLWTVREKSPLCQHLFAQARREGVNPRPDEHRAVLDALRRRDADGARQAMRQHLARVSEDLLAATELELIEKARGEIEARRRRLDLDRIA